jgi:hypothetical protein
MGKAETATRDKTFLALRIAGRAGRNSGSFLALLALCLIPSSGQQHPAAAGFHMQGPAALPDPKFTPGKVRTSDVKEVCEGGSTKQFRHTTEAMKAKAYAEYGIDKAKIYGAVFCENGATCDTNPKAPLYEIDHLISLELGGADELANLSPQPYYAHPGAHEKDQVENWLHKEVCAGKMDLAMAQAEIATDWYDLYLKMQAEKAKQSGAD